MPSTDRPTDRPTGARGEKGDKARGGRGQKKAWEKGEGGSKAEAGFGRAGSRRRDMRRGAAVAWTRRPRLLGLMPAEEMEGGEGGK